jgi:hypothetical protein
VYSLDLGSRYILRQRYIIKYRQSRRREWLNVASCSATAKNNVRGLCATGGGEMNRHTWYRLRAWLREEENRSYVAGLFVVLLYAVIRYSLGI